uniref:RING-type domain-containing protein n=1 Tax=Anas platyrhynchos TaxID=8839 RepID=A0A8B9QX75_ANAPL
GLHSLGHEARAHLGLEPWASVEDIRASLPTLFLLVFAHPTDTDANPIVPHMSALPQLLPNAAYVDPCSHRFCYACIQHWGRGSNTCPLFRQLFDSSARHRRNPARERVRNCPGRLYSLHPWRYSDAIRTWCCAACCR